MNDPDGQRPWLERASGFSWRYLLVLAAIYITFLAVATVEVVVVPTLLALFVAAALNPPVQWLKAHGWPPMAATWGAIAMLVPVVVLVGALLVPSFANGLGPLGEDLDTAIGSVGEWLSEGPLQLSQTEIDDYIQTGLDQLRDNAGNITTGLLGGATFALEIVTGVILTLLATFFYLKDGDRAFRALLARVRRPERVEAALAAAWRTLSSYVRGLAMVGFIDGALIGVGLAIVGTPLVLPLAVLVFIGGFFPIVGAFVSGLVAVAVSFVNGGAGDAIIVLAIVVGVQQLEGHVLYPIIFKRVLALHPLVILLAIAIGGVAFGIVGAFLSVPLTAVAVSLHEALADDPDTSLVGLLGSRPYETMPIAATPGEDIGDERAGSEG